MDGSSQLPPPKALMFSLPEGPPLRVEVQECPYDSGGLGCRVWGAAHLLTSELARDPSIVAGKTVLELGAGCGLAGLAAAALGARSVALTDALPGLLDALARGARLQAAQGQGQGQGQAVGEQADGPPAAAAAATGVSPAQPGPAAGGEAGSPWDIRCVSGCAVSVRMLLWEDEPAAGGAAAGSTPQPRPPSPPPHERTMLRDQMKRAPPCGCPTLAAGERFDVILGADLLYDQLQIRPLARAVANRLSPGGVCRLILTVRESELLPALVDQLEEEGLDTEPPEDAGELPLEYQVDTLADDEARTADI